MNLQNLPKPLVGNTLQLSRRPKEGQPRALAPRQARDYANTDHNKKSQTTNFWNRRPHQPQREKQNSHYTPDSPNDDKLQSVFLTIDLGVTQW